MRVDSKQKGLHEVFQPAHSIGWLLQVTVATTFECTLQDICEARSDLRARGTASREFGRPNSLRAPWPKLQARVLLARWGGMHEAEKHSLMRQSQTHRRRPFRGESCRRSTGSTGRCRASKATHNGRVPPQQTSTKMRGPEEAAADITPASGPQQKEAAAEKQQLTAARGSPTPEGVRKRRRTESARVDKYKQSPANGDRAKALWHEGLTQETSKGAGSCR